MRVPALDEPETAELIDELFAPFDTSDGCDDPLRAEALAAIDRWRGESSQVQPLGTARMQLGGGAEDAARPPASESSPAAVKLVRVAERVAGGGEPASGTELMAIAREMFEEAKS